MHACVPDFYYTIIIAIAIIINYHIMLCRISDCRNVPMSVDSYACWLYDMFCCIVILAKHPWHHPWHHMQVTAI